MIVCSFIRVTAATTLDQILAATATLEAAGVTGVGFLDGADTGGERVSAFESSTLASTVALSTTTIGVVGSVSALYELPFHTARRLATLDHFATGHSGWLLRTSSTGAEGSAYTWRSVADRAQELRRVREYAEINLELWNSWEDGAQWPDKESGDFKDDSRIHPINHRSDAFRVDGPLDVPPSPQRRPVLLAPVRDTHEVEQLVPYLDVAILMADTIDGVEALGAAVDAAAAEARSPTLLLIAAGDVGLTAAEAASAAASVGAAGVAMYLSADDVSAAVDLATGTDHGRGSTFAQSLGLTAFTHGGTAA